MALEGTEEEQVEALKKWWNENGKSLAMGIGLGLAVVGGWKAWGGYQVDIAKQASSVYQQLLSEIKEGPEAKNRILTTVELIRTEFPSSSYATLASLNGAAVNLGAGETEEAKQQLQWVMDNASDKSYKYVAQERLARLALSENNLELASSILGNVAPDGFGGIFYEIQGDILVAQGDKQAAAAAYTLALQDKVVNTRLVQMKMDDLGLAQ